MMTTQRKPAIPRSGDVVPLTPDLASAILLGFVEAAQVAVTPEAIVQYDRYFRPALTQTGWLTGDDPLAAATREYLDARREASRACGAGQTGWSALGAGKAREQAVRRALAARSRALAILRERGTLAVARKLQMHVIENG
jgi:hypothetical protein